jgi:hypothetical protein
MWHHLLTSIDLAQGQGGVIPDPPPGKLPGQFGTLANTVIGWLKTCVLVAGVGGLLICAIMITIGRRNRNAMAAEGVAGATWVLGGLALASSAATVVGVFMPS